MFPELKAAIADIAVFMDDDEGPNFDAAQQRAVDAYSTELLPTALGGEWTRGHRNGERVQLISRRGVDWGDRFPLKALATRSCTIDGEVIACDGDGLADFELLRYRRRDEPVTLVAFDLIEIDGLDLRCEPIEERKAELARLLLSCRTALVINHVFDAPGPDVFQHACKLGCEGIISKRRRSRYVADRTEYWLRVKNPTAPAVRREAEEDWGPRR
jgi:ATP-dependent DNA ligase